MSDPRTFDELMSSRERLDIHPALTHFGDVAYTTPGETMTKRNNDVMSVGCPFCKAEADADCVRRTDGNVAIATHIARFYSLWGLKPTGSSLRRSKP